MAGKLDGKTVAMLAADGFEQVELTEPKKALEAAGARVQVVSPSGGSVQGFNHMDKGDTVPVDVELKAADADAFDALVIPGGLYNPDHLRTNEQARAFARAFFEAGKPVGAICHGPQVLISADLVRGRTMTSFEAVQVDLRNAGAEVRDEEVVVDRGLVTSRNPDDIPAFCAKLVDVFAEAGRSAHAQAAE